MPLIGAIVLFVIYAVNVALGAATNSAFMSDVGEMLILGAVAILFVIAILKKEADAREKRGK